MSDLLVDLAEAKQNWDREDGYSAELLRTHHATIQQNAEDAKRLRALEMALAAISPLASTTAYKIRKRADEILREGEGCDDSSMG